MTKRILACFVAFFLMIGCFQAGAEGIGAAPSELTHDELFEVGDTLYYTGGIIARGFLKGSDATSVGELIQFAYVLTDDPYIILGDETTWEVTITGGTGNYECLAVLAYQADLSLDPFEDSWSVLDYFDVDSDTFDYTFTEPGRYYWEFRLSDDAGQFFYFQTRIYETYEVADQTDEATVVGKVNSIVAEYITDDMSDYSRALVLHDWLIYNANYDYTFTNYDASGVLLYGTGVCDSYARAYLMLCTAAGLECVYVSGTAGTDPNPDNWGNHGWNLVKLGGSWYHVDCTWDDPGQGGSEQHAYFCVSDETMLADHRWNRQDDVFDAGGMMVPEAEGGDLEAVDGESQDYDFTFSTIEEFEQQMDLLVAAGEYRSETIGKYVGEADLTEVWNEFSDWTLPYAQSLANQGLVTAVGSRHRNEYFFYSLTWVNPDDFVRIDETSVLVSTGEICTITVAQSYPENALVGTWTSSDTAVADVEAVYDAERGFCAMITGKKEGTSTITVTTDDGLSDSFTVTVLPPYQPEFGFTATEAEDVFTFTWNSVPGATEYQLQLIGDGSNTVLTTVNGLIAEIARSQIPVNADQQVCVVARRVIDGNVVASYTSEPVTIRAMALEFTSYIPAGTTMIDASAFQGDVSLTTVYLPDSVETLGASAFAGCTGLTAIRIPANVARIGDGAFSNSGLIYAQVVKGSYADTWMQTHCPHVKLIYED